MDTRPTVAINNYNVAYNPKNINRLCKEFRLALSQCKYFKMLHKHLQNNVAGDAVFERCNLRLHTSCLDGKFTTISRYHILVTSEGKHKLINTLKFLRSISDF